MLLSNSSYQILILFFGKLFWALVVEKTIEERIRIDKNIILFFDTILQL
jgi:hypothetical protein